MPNEIYHRSDWGESKAEDFGDVYYDHAATNKLYNHSDYYENSDGTDATLKDLNNKASIVLTPTAYSDGSLNTVIPPYQVLPTELVTNGTFDTDSNWTATNSTISISNGVCQVNPTATFGYLNSTSSFQTGIGKKYVYSFDCISRTGSGNVYLQIGTFQNGNNVTNQNIGDIEDNTSYNITFTATSTTSYLRIGFGGSGTSATIDNVSIKEIQEADFDFSRGSSATRVNEQGLVENSQGDDFPRIDYTDGTGSLLLEPQSTNKVTQSETFSTWATTNALKTSVNLTAPDGSNSVIKLSSSNTIGGEHKVRTDTDTTSATDSIFAKMGEVRYIYNRRSTTQTGYQSVVFDLQEGVVHRNNYSTNAYPKITYYGNGWYRCEVYYENLSANATGWGLSDGNAHTYDAPNTTDGLYIWGVQQEDLSYATSYIPTSGSTVTRSADVANNSGNADLFNDSEGVLYAEIAALADDGTNRIISLSDGSADDRVSLLFGTSINRIRAIVKSNGSTSFDEEYEVTSTLDYHKVAIKYKLNNFALWIDGVERFTDTSGSTPIGLNKLMFDIGSGSANFYGKTKALAVFKEALSHDLLERLTGEGYESFRLLAEANNYTII